MNEYVVAALQENTFFDAPLYLKDGTVIAQANQSLTKSEIDRLIKWKIEKVYTEGKMHAKKSVDDLLSEAEESPFPPEPQSAKKTEKKPGVPAGGSSRFEEIKHARRLREIRQNKDNVIKNYDILFEKTKKLLENMAIGIPVEKKNIDEIAKLLISDVAKAKNFYIACIMSKSSFDYIFSHCLNVSILSVIMGLSLGYDPVKLYEITVAGLIHDVGMLKIPKHIREKKRRLEESEFNLIKAHPIHGYRVITKYSHIFSVAVATAILQHHESYDGKGYPQSLSSSAIVEYARILSIVDSYEALTKKRAYREEFMGYEAMKNLLQESSNRYDPVFLKKFLANIAIYPISSVVQLNNNNYGVVISANNKLPLRPVVKVIFNESKVRLAESEIIDLALEIKYTIKRVVDKNELQISPLDEF